MGQENDKDLLGPLYVPIRKISMKNAYFMFFDTEPYLADQIFVRNKIRVWFDREYAKPGSPYLAIMCHVRKKDVDGFLASLEELGKSMMLCGHADYRQKISEFLELTDLYREKAQNAT